MIEYWERSVVTGRGEEDRYAKETVIHRRGEDAMQLAIRRNPMLAACSRIEVQTMEAFMEIRGDEQERRKEDIPRIRDGEEWDW